MYSADQTAEVTIISYKPQPGVNFDRYLVACPLPLQGSISPCCHDIHVTNTMWQRELPHVATVRSSQSRLSPRYSQCPVSEPTKECVIWKG